MARVEASPFLSVVEVVDAAPGAEELDAVVVEDV